VHDKDRHQEVNPMNPYEDITLITEAEESPYMDKQKANEALNEWMFISIDRDGKVIINSISKVMFIYKANKFVIMEPSKNESKFMSVACRFRSMLHPQAKINDFVNLIAIGNT